MRSNDQTWGDIATESSLETGLWVLFEKREDLHKKEERR